MFKKLVSLLLTAMMALSMSGCAFFEMTRDQENVVDLGDGKTFVKWNLVLNNNEYRPVDSAYFEFNDSTFKYYENGQLKKEGTHRITYYGVENTISPLHLNLEFGKDDTGLSVFDYIDCYTEDAKENLHQFTIISEGYHIDPIRSGGVPVRDYHLSEMPYAFGTYVKEGEQQYTYKNGKANYLNCSKLDGTFCDEKGNKFYFANNSFSSDSQSSSYTVYMRYENAINNTFIEGTIHLSYYDEFLGDKRHDVAIIYVLHGDMEPAEEKGTYVDADYQLMDFILGSDDSFAFAYGEYYYENDECDYAPSNFIGGTYRKISKQNYVKLL